MMKYMLPTLTMAMLITVSVMAQSGHEGHDHSDDHAPELIITPISPNQLTAGEENEVMLFIQDKSAKPVDESQLEIIHTKPVHLLIIDPSLTDYHHEHPTQTATGQFMFTFTPQTACSYRAWADIKLKGAHQHYIPIELAGAETCTMPFEKIVNLEASSQGYDFKLTLDGNLKAGAEVMASLTISQAGKPVNSLQPVMGAFAHMVGFYEDYESIAHIHPMGAEPTEETQRGGPTLRCQIAPEQAGYLKIFAQVQIDGKQIFAPFGLMVE